MISGLWAQGRLIIPEHPPQFKPDDVYLKSVDAKIELRQHVAGVKLDQVFFNKSQVQLEGEYIFALGEESEIHDFNLYIDGKRAHGRLLESNEAYNTYTDIVRKLRDPALLEYAGERLFKARIFPVLPRNDRRIELSYSQILNREGNLYRFDLPIRQSGQAVIESYHAEIDLFAGTALANIYSPTHTINIRRVDERHAKISFEATNLEGAKNFTLLYSLSEQEINGNALSFRPRTDRDGYFMFMASPRFEVQQIKELPKDIIFVIDISGSMEGEKIEQARDALRFCINTLRPDDRFEIIAFSSGLQSFQGQMNHAAPDAIQNARYFIDKLTSNGGTNINEALQTALKLKKNEDTRPTSIIFLTDGLPTEGEQNISKIISNVKNLRKDFIRTFCFGVGYDVNTFLLDQIAAESHGAAQYVKPGENIESSVSQFFAKISAPALTDIRLVFNKTGIYDIYPQRLPDIFRGQHIIVFGRYREPGSVEVELSGNEGGKKRSFTYRIELKEREQDSEFISRLWANRKVAHLMQQIRFNGENPELVESIKKLGAEFGIVTPYTSYLVTEQNIELAAAGEILSAGGGDAATARFMQTQQARNSKAESDEEAVGGVMFYEAMQSAQRGVGASAGKGAVLSSRALQKVAESESAEDMLLTVRRCADRAFNLKNSIWIEEGVDASGKVDQKIRFLSDEYFAMAKLDQQLKMILAQGSEVIFRWQGKVYQVASK
jgi:Ca-activated chloride channel family protein